MSNITTQAICLNRKKINTKSSYLTLFTRKMGIIEVYSYGSNNPKSPLNKGAQPFVYANYTISGKKSFKLSEVEVIDSFYNIREDYDKFLNASFLSKLVSMVIVDGANSKDIYEMFVNSIFIIRKNNDFFTILNQFFEVMVARYMGILPYIDQNNLKKYLNIDGTITSKKGINAISIMSIYDILNLSIIDYLRKAEADKKIIEFFDEYLNYHLDIDVKNLRNMMKNFK